MGVPGAGSFVALMSMSINALPDKTNGLATSGAGAGVAACSNVARRVALGITDDFCRLRSKFGRVQTRTC